jgi:hypothetical protein
MISTFSEHYDASVSTGHINHYSPEWPPLRSGASEW